MIINKIVQEIRRNMSMCGQTQPRVHKHGAFDNINHHCRAHHPNPTPGHQTTHHQCRENPSKRANMNIATLNMRGGTAHNMMLLQKWSAISKTMYKHRIGILALQEMHLDQEKTRQVCECFSKNLEIIILEDLDDPTGKAGVAFVINKTVLNPRELKTKELHPGWALLLKIKWLETCESTLLNVYVPTNRAAQKPF